MRKCLTRPSTQFLLYLSTALTMALSGYVHLGRGPGVIADLNVSLVLENWPIVFAGVGCPLLIGAALVTPLEPRLAARIALGGALFACFYHLLALCFLFTVALFFACVSPFMVSGILSLITLIHWTLANSQRPQG